MVIAPFPGAKAAAGAAGDAESDEEDWDMTKSKGGAAAAVLHAVYRFWPLLNVEYDTYIPSSG